MRIRYVLLFLPLLLVLLLFICMSHAFASSPANMQPGVQKLQQQIVRSEALLQTVTQEYQQYSSDIAGINQELTNERIKLFQAQAQLASTKVSLNKRIAFYYRNGPSCFLSALMDSTDFSDFLRRTIALTTILDHDTSLLKKLKIANSLLKQEQIRLAQLQVQKKQRLAVVIGKQATLRRELALRTRQLTELNQSILMSKTPEAFKIAMVSRVTNSIDRGYTARGDIRRGFIFPVNGPHQYTDSWGSSRSGGRRHKGTDIMAMHGTPVVACISGCIERASRTDHGLGGITLYLRGIDGNQYYYAHLDGIVTNITEGTRVASGQLIAFVGSTGNASSTAPHLHFEIHPGGRGAIDPYQTLKHADAR